MRLNWATGTASSHMALTSAIQWMTKPTPMAVTGATARRMPRIAEHSPNATRTRRFATPTSPKIVQQ